MHRSTTESVGHSATIIEVGQRLRQRCLERAIPGVVAAWALARGFGAVPHLEPPNLSAEDPLLLLRTVDDAALEEIARQLLRLQQLESGETVPRPLELTVLNTLYDRT